MHIELNISNIIMSSESGYGSPPPYVAVPEFKLQKDIYILCCITVIGNILIMSLSIFDLIFGIYANDLLIIYCNTISVTFVLFNFVCMYLGGVRKECFIINILVFLYYVINHVFIFVIYMYDTKYIDSIYEICYTSIGLILIGVSKLTLNKCNK